MIMKQIEPCILFNDFVFFFLDSKNCFYFSFTCELKLKKSYSFQKLILIVKIKYFF